MNNTELIEKLKMEVAEAPDPECIDIMWERYYESLRECLLNKDPNNFLQWIPILKTMHSGGVGKSIRKYYDVLKSHPDYDTWIEAAKENSFGNPTYFFKDKGVSPTSIKHAVHLQRFQDTTGLQIVDMKHILEFGGGYGSMRRIIDRLGFEGDYMMYDMPLLAALQKFYLGTLEIPTSINSQLEPLQRDIRFFIPEYSLFIATSSLSEAPLTIRYLMRDLVQEFRGILIVFTQNMGDRVNNRVHFEEWMREMQHYTWHCLPIKENKIGSYYLFGVRDE